jgi:phosphoenolpyruvate carboxykinase (ATP)
MTFQLPDARSVARNPSQDELRTWALELLPADRVQRTRHGNIAYRARTRSRLGPSTFFVSDVPTGKQVMSRADAAEWAARQDAYIAEQDMVLLEGLIGPRTDLQVGTRLYIERSQANIAGMQEHLYFPPEADHDAAFTVIYTPNLTDDWMPNGALIIIDLDNYVTRVFGSDYFGESKMGSLRMWNHWILERGGLAMHSGAKTFPAESTPTGQEQLALIIGMSGTGKTTTTFRNVKGSLPVQDDFIALMPDGTVYTTEAGCFAKTFGLDPEDEPTIHGGAISEGAWLESVGVTADGEIDFNDDSYTANGRVTFPMSIIRHRAPTDLPEAKYLFILNRNNSIIPAVAKLDRRQAAHYFMLGETMGTSAGGASEAGKNLRVPGTNPFWFEDESSMGNRFLELLEQVDLDVYLLNTGRIGGEDEATSKKITISDSAAVQSAIVDGSIEWVEDPDFGYLVATSLPGIADVEKLQPRRLYEAQGRLEEYRGIVARLEEERTAFLAGFASLDPRILSPR